MMTNKRGIVRQKAWRDSFGLIPLVLKRTAETASPRNDKKRNGNDKVNYEIALSTAFPRNDKVGRGFEIASTVKLSRNDKNKMSNDKKRNWNDKTFLVGLFVFSVMMSVGGMGYSAEVSVVGVGEAVKVELPTKMKEITGIVIARTRMNLSVETSHQGSTAFEMVLPFDKTTKLRGYRHYDEIARGDTIKAVCKQTYEVQKDGSERIMGTMAAQISLVKSRSSGKLTSKEL